MIKTYIKKQPFQIQAVQWTGDNTLEIQAFQSMNVNSNAMYWTPDDEIVISTLEGDMLEMSKATYIPRASRRVGTGCHTPMSSSTM